MAEHDQLPLTPLSFQILLALADRPRHGYAILKEIERASGEALRSSTGTLYLALARLEQEGLLAEQAGTPSDDARRRTYRLTALGREVARAETARLATLLGVARVKRLLGRQQLEDLLEPT